MKKTICRLGKRLNPDRENKKEGLVGDKGLPLITETCAMPKVKTPKRETDIIDKKC